MSVPPLEITPRKRLKLFGGRAHPQLARDIAAAVGVELGAVELKTFTSGEVYCRFEDSVRGEDVFLIQPICANPDVGLGLNDALMELMVMVDAAVGASAHRVVAVCPWFAYARQDKRSKPREPISARVVAQMLEHAGADRIMAMDLHAGQLQGFLATPMDHLTALPVLAERFRGIEDLVVVAPDAGRVKLNKHFADMLGAPLALLHKTRPAQQRAEISHLVGDVTGKRALILDDMIDTGGTLAAGGWAVLAAGAAEVLAAATHPVFSGDAHATLAASPFSSIVVCDTIPLKDGVPAIVERVSCAPAIAESIVRAFYDDSVSAVFGGENQVF